MVWWRKMCKCKARNDASTVHSKWYFKYVKSWRCIVYNDVSHVLCLQCCLCWQEIWIWRLGLAIYLRLVLCFTVVGVIVLKIRQSSVGICIENKVLFQGHYLFVLNFGCFDIGISSSNPEIMSLIRDEQGSISSFFNDSSVCKYCIVSWSVKQSSRNVSSSTVVSNAGVEFTCKDKWKILE